MSAMVQILSCGKRWNVPFKEEKPRSMEHYLSPNENIAQMRTHSLFVLYNLYKVSNSTKKSKKKYWKPTLAQAKHFISHVSNSTW